MKKRTLDEYRQTKEYKLSDQEGKALYQALRPCKCAEPKHIESYEDPVKQVMAQQIDEELEQEDLDKAAAEGSTRHWPKEIIERDYIEEAKIEIVNKVSSHFHDMLFEMICEEMSSKYVFQSQNYLTEAGLEEFEEQFFEFYHEHHGEILYKVLKNITNG